MSRRSTLPAPPAVPVSGLTGRLRAWLTRTRSGRILLAVAGLLLLESAGLPFPEPIPVLLRVVLAGYGVYFGWRLLRHLVRRLLWRIRTKLIVSYLFVAVVPVVLLLLFFFIAGLLSLTLVASYMVSSQLDRTAQELRTIVQTALAGLDLEDPRLGSILARRLAPARALHPGLSYTLVRGGGALAASGEAPREMPAWLRGTSFAGLVGVKGRGDVLRALQVQEGSLLVLDVPFDEVLCARLRERTGIRVVPGLRFARVETREGRVRMRLQEEEEAAAGMNSFALADRTDWATGEMSLEPLQIQFRPQALIARLSPASRNVGGELLFKGMAIVGAVFLVMYAVALAVGLTLARSITGSVHALSQGTERVRRGELGQPIQVRSRDQLGELAESFNLMARGIQDLLREQAEKDRLEEELRIARQIQMSLLPKDAVSLPGLRVTGLCLPAAEVGGDYYDLLPLSETRMAVLVADVSGKGTSAALYMAELKGLVLSLSRVYDSPARLLAEANRILAAHLDPRSFITMTYAVVDVAAGIMRYARAGHNPILHLEAETGRTRVLAPQGLGLGLDPGERFEEILEEAETGLRSRDVFVFFTDGLTEAMNARAELFGEGRLREAIERWGAEESDESALKERLLEEIRSFAGGAAQHDDMTLVILKVV